MSRWLLGSLAVVPSVVLFALVLLGLPKPARWRSPAAMATLFASLMVGVLVAYACLYLEGGVLAVGPWNQLGSLGGMALFWLVVAGVTEEGTKYLGLRLYSWRLSTFTFPYDALVYAIAVGLGFAAAENISYVLRAAEESQGQARHVLWTRALTAVPFHGMMGVILGSYLGDAKRWARQGRRWGFLHVAGVGWAATWHGIYDLLISQPGPVASWLVVFLLIGLTGWSLFTLRQARRMSLAMADGAEGAALSSVRPRPQRNPVVSGVLSLVMPGLGQVYNGDIRKGALLALAAVINNVALVAMWLLVLSPELFATVLSVFGGLGVLLPEQVLQRMEGAIAFPIVLTILATASWLFAAYDAYRTALRRRTSPQGDETLETSGFGASLYASYVVHLVGVALFLLVPLFDKQQQAASSPPPLPPGLLEMEVVLAPETLDGFQNKPEGTDAGRDEKNERQAGDKTDGEKAEAKEGEERGVDKNQKKTVELLQPEEKQDDAAKKDRDEFVLPKKGKKGTSPKEASKGDNGKGEMQRRAQGIIRSYNEYLTIMLHQRHDPYFEQVEPWQHTVVQYTIRADGSVVSVHVMYDHTSAPPEVAELAASQVRRLNPALPLPAGVRSIMVTELFWRGVVLGPPGTLEYRLSRLPDGRMIMPSYDYEAPPTEQPPPAPTEPAPDTVE